MQRSIFNNQKNDLDIKSSFSILWLHNSKKWTGITVKKQKTKNEKIKLSF